MESGAVDADAIPPDVVRGGIAMLRWTRSLPWATMTIDADEIVVRRSFGRSWTFARVMASVEWYPASFLRPWTCASLSSAELGEWHFTPWRPSLLRGALVRHRWMSDGE